MGREPTWSEAEDDLLLATKGVPAVEVNRRLVEMGSRERTPTQIKQRRAYLETRRAVAVSRGNGSGEPADDEVRLIDAVRRRRQLREEREALTVQLYEVEQLIKQLGPGYLEGLQ